MINNLNELKEFAEEVKKKLNEDSAFERLLQVLVNYGMDEEIAAQMIADCINEQYELDKIADSFNNIYQDNKDVAINNGINYKA